MAHDPSEWERLRGVIYHYYLVKNLTLKTLKRKLLSEHNFDDKDRAFKQHFKDWHWEHAKKIPRVVYLALHVVFSTRATPCLFHIPVNMGERIRVVDGYKLGREMSRQDLRSPAAEHSRQYSEHEIRDAYDLLSQRNIEVIPAQSGQRPAEMASRRFIRRRMPLLAGVSDSEEPEDMIVDTSSEASDCDEDNLSLVRESMEDEYASQRTMFTTQLSGRSLEHFSRQEPRFPTIRLNYTLHEAIQSFPADRAAWPTELALQPVTVTGEFEHSADTAMTDADLESWSTYQPLHRLDGPRERYMEIQIERLDALPDGANRRQAVRFMQFYINMCMYGYRYVHDVDNNDRNLTRESLLRMLNENNQHVLPSIFYVIVVLRGREFSKLEEVFLADCAVCVHKTTSERKQLYLTYLDLFSGADQQVDFFGPSAEMEKLLKKVRNTFGSNSMSSVTFQYQSALLLIERQLWERALSLLERSLEVAERISGRSHILTLSCLFMIAQVYKGEGRLDQTNIYLNRCLSNMPLRLADQLQAWKFKVMEERADVHIKLSNDRYAAQDLREVLECRCRIFGPVDHQTTNVAMRLVEFYADRGFGTEAGQLYHHFAQSYHEEYARHWGSNNSPNTQPGTS